MRDIIHPYIGLGGIPVRPSAASARETAEMERIRTEILRLGAVNGAAPDWRTVVDCAVIVLRDQRKDLQVACYLAWGLFEREGYLGLAAGLTIVKDMTALYWDTLHPPVDRPKARLACLDWLAENLSARVDRRLPAEGDGAALDRALGTLVDLEEDLKVRFGHKAPPFGHVRRQVAEYLGQLPGPRPAPVLLLEDTAPPTPPPVSDRPPPPPPPAAPAPTVVIETLAPTTPPAPPPSRPRLAKRILTPAERSRRRARGMAAAAVILLVVGLSGAGAAYWVLEVKQIEDVAALLTADTPETRAAGLSALKTLPERQQAALLHDHARAILDHYLRLADQEADRTAFADAEAHLEAARHLYPDSARLIAATHDLDRRRANLPAEIKRRLTDIQARLLTHINETLPDATARDARTRLRTMRQRMDQGDLRNARAELDRLAALVPASDDTMRALVPRLAALAFVDLAEQRADRQRYTRSLQVIADGLTFLPGNALLHTAQNRYRIGRDAFLLRATIQDPESLDSLLVREAAEHLRATAPLRFQALTLDLAAPLQDALSDLATRDPERAHVLRTRAESLLKLIPPEPTPEIETPETLTGDD